MRDPCASPENPSPAKWGFRCPRRQEDPARQLGTPGKQLPSPRSPSPRPRGRPRSHAPPHARRHSPAHGFGHVVFIFGQIHSFQSVCPAHTNGAVSGSPFSQLALIPIRAPRVRLPGRSDASRTHVLPVFLVHILLLKMNFPRTRDRN